MKVSAWNDNKRVGIKYQKKDVNEFKATGIPKSKACLSFMGRKGFLDMWKGDGLWWERKRPARLQYSIKGLLFTLRPSSPALGKRMNCLPQHLQCLLHFILSSHPVMTGILNFRAGQNHLESCWNIDSWSKTRVSNSVCLKENLRICISYSCSGDTEAINPGPTL